VDRKVEGQQMSELTREQIEEWRKWGIPQFLPTGVLAHNELCDMALRSLTPSATGAARGKSEFEAGFDAGFAKAMLDLGTQAAQVEVTAMPYEILGDILMRYVDRLSDAVDTDPLEKILEELLAALDGRGMKGQPDRPDWARQLPGAELYDRAARYEYVRTLNPRQFAALYDEALADERFDDVVDRHRMKGGK
jgi:hypothetical protein